MCGPSQNQKDIAASNAAFSRTLQKNFEARFAGQSEILEKLNNSLTSSIAGGPGQRGFNQTERQLALARGLDRTTANYENAARAVSGNLAGRGGDSGLMSGVDAQIKAALAGDAAKTLSENQTNLELADFAQGHDQYNRSLAGMNTLAGNYNPEQFGQLAGQAGGQAFDQAKSIDAQKGGFWKTLGGIAKVGIGIGASALTGGASKAASVGSRIASGAASLANPISSFAGYGRNSDVPQYTTDTGDLWKGFN